jgi:hypothetical protein
LRARYWSCTKFADWIRGTAKLDAGTSEEWQVWQTQAQKFSAFRYWLAEDGLSALQNFFNYIPDKLNAIRYYVNNRWVSRSHACTAHARDIKPGTWCDVGNRFLPCLFNELVDFVEIETAWHHVSWDTEARKKYQTPWWRSGWLRWRTWRCAEAGIAHLQWASELTNADYCGVAEAPELTPQALAAQEILELYAWWTITYPSRPEPMEASGWSAYCDANREAHGGEFLFETAKSPELRAQADAAQARMQEIEAAYESEDTEMLIRLIQIRNYLWT